MNDLPSWCCASGCRHCSAFREHAKQPEATEPPAAWCKRCDATTYTRNGRCVACEASA